MRRRQMIGVAPFRHISHRRQCLCFFQHWSNLEPVMLCATEIQSIDKMSVLAISPSSNIHSDYWEAIALFPNLINNWLNLGVRSWQLLLQRYQWYMPSTCMFFSGQDLKPYTVFYSTWWAYVWRYRKRKSWFLQQRLLVVHLVIVLATHNAKLTKTAEPPVLH
jgi:hypothetical protein